MYLIIIMLDIALNRFSKFIAACYNSLDECVLQPVNDVTEGSTQEVKEVFL